MKILASYTIVEGSRAVIGELEAQWPLDRKPDVVEAYFESFEPARSYDAIEMGFVLEHVDDPALIVRRYKRFLKPGGFIGMAVPNARSLHRLIGAQCPRSRAGTQALFRSPLVQATCGTGRPGRAADTRHHDEACDDPSACTTESVAGAESRTVQGG